MKSVSAGTCRTIITILIVSSWFTAYADTNVSTPVVSTSSERDAAQIDKRFTSFKKKLEQHLSERVAEITNWMPSEPGDHFATVIADVRASMRMRLEQIQDQFVENLNEESLKKDLREALSTDEDIDTEVNKYLKKADSRFLAQYYTSRAELAALLSSRPLSLSMQRTIWGVSIVAFLILIVGIVLIIRGAQHSQNETLEPAGLFNGTIRTIIALAVIYLVFLLALLDYIVRQRIPDYLFAALIIVIISFLGNRVVDAFLYARKAGFIFSKTFPDGTREKLQSYEHPESSMKETLMRMHESIEKLHVALREGRFAKEREHADSGDIRRSPVE